MNSKGEQSSKSRFPDGQKYANIDTILSDQGLQYPKSSSLLNDLQNQFPSGKINSKNKKSIKLIKPKDGQKNSQNTSQNLQGAIMNSDRKDSNEKFKLGFGNSTFENQLSNETFKVNPPYDKIHTQPSP